MAGCPIQWKAREERCQKEQAERDKLFEKTLTLARKQSWVIKTMIDDEEHEERRDDMRSAYLEHGAEFDPHQIQECQGPTRHYEDITETPQASPPPFNVFPGGQSAYNEAEGHQLVGGLCSPPPFTPSQRSAADMLGYSPTGSQLPSPLSPPREPRGPMVGTAMQPTPVMTCSPPRSMSAPPAPMAVTPPPMMPPHSPQCDDATPTSSRTALTAHQALLDRAKRTLDEASRRYNLVTSQFPHPLSHGFSTPSPQPQKYSSPTPCTSRMTPSPRMPETPPTPPQQAPLATPCYTQRRMPESPPALSCNANRDFILDEPALQFRSRLSPGQQSPPPTMSSPGRTRRPPRTAQSPASVCYSSG